MKKKKRKESETSRKAGEGEEKSVSWRNLLHSRFFFFLSIFTSDEPRCLSQSVWHLPLVVISDVCNVLASHFSDRINWICACSPLAMLDKLVGPAQWIDVSCVNVLMLHHEWVRNVAEVTTLSTLIIALLVPETNLTSSIPSLRSVGGVVPLVPFSLNSYVGISLVRLIVSHIATKMLLDPPKSSKLRRVDG